MHRHYLFIFQLTSFMILEKGSITLSPFFSCIKIKLKSNQRRNTVDLSSMALIRHPTGLMRCNQDFITDKNGSSIQGLELSLDFLGF